MTNTKDMGVKHLQWTIGAISIVTLPILGWGLMEINNIAVALRECKVRIESVEKTLDKIDESKKEALTLYEKVEDEISENRKDINAVSNAVEILKVRNRRR